MVFDVKVIMQMPLQGVWTLRKNKPRSRDSKRSLLSSFFLLSACTLNAQADLIGGGSVLRQVKQAYESLSGQVGLEASVHRIVLMGEYSKESRRVYRMLEWDGGRLIHLVGGQGPGFPELPGTSRVRWFDGKLLLVANYSKKYWVSEVGDPGAVFFRVKMEQVRNRLYGRFEDLELETLRDISSAKRVNTQIADRKLEALQVKWKDKLGEYTAWIEPDTHLVYRLQATFREGRTLVREEVEWTKVNRNTDAAEIQPSILAGYKRGEFFEDWLPY